MLHWKIKDSAEWEKMIKNNEQIEIRKEIT
jgi:hypothetical protein